MLKESIPIERAQMRLRITALQEGKKLKEKLIKVSSIESEEWQDGSATLVSVKNYYLVCRFLFLLCQQLLLNSVIVPIAYILMRYCSTYTYLEDKTADHCQ